MKALESLIRPWTYFLTNFKTFLNEYFVWYRVIGYWNLYKHMQLKCN